MVYSSLIFLRNLESMDETTKAIEQVALTAQSQAELAQKLN